MSTQEPQRADKARAIERRHDLELDAEMVKDLEPAEGAAQVRGGGATALCEASIGGQGPAAVHSESFDHLNRSAARI